MTSPLPTSPALDAMVVALVRKCAPYVRVSEDIAAIRRAQDHATLDSIHGSHTLPDPAQTSVFDIEAYRAARVMVHDDDPEAA